MSDGQLLPVAASEDAQKHVSFASAYHNCSPDDTCIIMEKDGNLENQNNFMKDQQGTGVRMA
jgi:hypothetical protein